MEQRDVNVAPVQGRRNTVRRRWSWKGSKQKMEPKQKIKTKKMKMKKMKTKKMKTKKIETTTKKKMKKKMKKKKLDTKTEEED